MKICPDNARLALLIALQEGTHHFSDPGMIAILHWYEKEFAAARRKNLTAPLDLTNIELQILPNWVTLPLAFGVPYVQLAENPELTDITSLQAMPILTKLGTIEHAMDTANSPELALTLETIRTVLLNTKDCIRLSLKGLKHIPVYIQLLSDIEVIILVDARDIKSLKPIRNFSKLKRLSLNEIHCVPNLKDLINLPIIDSLNIYHACHQTILEGINNLRHLKDISISWGSMLDLEPLKKLAKLEYLSIYACDNLQDFRLGSELPNLQKLDIASLRELREFSIDHSCISLKCLTITMSSYLEVVTGIHLLSNLEELELSANNNLHTITGLESAAVLKKITIGRLPPSLIKRSLKTQIASGKYRSFLANDTEIDLEHDSIPESKPISVKLLAQEIITLAAPTTLSKPQTALPKAVYPLVVPELLRSSPKIQTFQ